jgi:hypothetical protein
MVVRTEKTNVPQRVIPSVSVDVIQVNRDPAGMRIALGPSTHFAMLATRFDQISTNAGRGSVIRPRPINFAIEPPLDEVAVLVFLLTT